MVLYALSVLLGCLLLSRKIFSSYEQDYKIIETCGVGREGVCVKNYKIIEKWGSVILNEPEIGFECDLSALCNLKFTHFWFSLVTISIIVPPLKMYNKKKNKGLNFTNIKLFTIHCYLFCISCDLYALKMLIKFTL